MKADNTGPQVRILVVDDHQAFRQFVSSTLHKQPNLQVIGEIEDGLEAVKQAERLQPDVILLDIGLPGLNGIEAARRIRELAPETRIVFLTQESSTDVVHEALSLGAWGYVIKAQAGSELVDALKAVGQGNRFVSKGLDGYADFDLA